MDFKTTHTIRRIARIWSIIIIGLGVLMFIAEIIAAFTTESEPYPFYENIIPFTMFTAVVGLAVAWKWEGVGGAITIISVLANLGVYLLTGRTAVGAVMVILIPLMIPGILFLVYWSQSRQGLETSTP
jgi:hypothetical protein